MVSVTHLNTSCCCFLNILIIAKQLGVELVEWDLLLKVLLLVPGCDSILPTCPLHPPKKKAPRNYLCKESAWISD